MSLGTCIAALRAARGLSQAELGELLQVSRQSVSKWETDASVPELDKLLRLAQTFDITLDQLVKDDEAGTAERKEGAGSSAAVETATPSLAAPRQPLRVIVGSALLLFGGVMALIFSLQGSPLSTVPTIALPFFICGILCLLIEDLLPLWCLWSLFLLAFLWEWEPWHPLLKWLETPLTPIILVPVTAWLLRRRLWGSPQVRGLLAWAWPVGAAVCWITRRMGTQFYGTVILWLSQAARRRWQFLGAVLLKLSCLSAWALAIAALAALFYYLPKLPRKKRSTSQ